MPRVAQSAACNASREANGAWTKVRSAIHGECSNNGPQIATKPARSRRFSSASGIGARLMQSPFPRAVLSPWRCPRSGCTSAGLWLMPSRLAMKIIAVGKYGAKIAASCNAPLATVGNARPCFAAAARARPQIDSLSGIAGRASLASSSIGKPRRAAICATSCLIRWSPCSNISSVRARKVDAKPHAAGMTLIPFGSTFKRPTVTTCERFAIQFKAQLFERDTALRRADECVVAIGHLCRAGVIRHAVSVTKYCRRPFNAFTTATVDSLSTSPGLARRATRSARDTACC